MKTRRPVTRRAMCPLCGKPQETDALPDVCPYCQAQLGKLAPLPPSFPPGAVLATLRSLPLGTRVRLSGSECATLEAVNDCRARVRLDTRRVREFDAVDPKTGETRHVVAASSVYRDLAPGAEVMIL